MAEWEPSTSYSPGNEVTYLGLNYRRSQYPLVPTSGTNPKEEMSVDPKGDPIRTWELKVASNSKSSYPFHIGYFSLLAPERSDGLYIKIPPLTNYPGKLYPENPYAGSSQYQLSAYGEVLGFYPEVIGASVEMDQQRPASPPVPPSTPAYPYAPVMPAEKCGVAMQQFQETPTPEPVPTDPYLNATNAYAGTGVLYYQNLTYNPITEKWYEDLGALPRKFYVFLIFNHPLYFRRQHTITFRISTYTYTGGYTIPSDPPVFVPGTAEGFYSSTTVNVLPTDDNYWSSTYSNFADFIKPANAITTYTLPNDETTPGPYGSVDGINYQIVEIYVSDVESND